MLEPGSPVVAGAAPGLRSAGARRKATDVAAVALGGCLGTAARYLLEEGIAPLGGWFPAATFAANLCGAFALGFFLEYLLLAGDDTGGRRAARLFFGTGACGSFTTYGTMVLEGLGIASAEPVAFAALYLGLSLCAGAALAAFGMSCARILLGEEGGSR